MDTSFGENMVVFYLAIFGILGIVKLFIDSINLQISNNLYWGFLIVVFFFYLLSWNFSLVNHEIACNGPNGYVALYSTIMPFTFIFMLGCYILYIFPGWLRSFSNTFGLTFVQLCGFTLYDENENMNPIITKINNNDNDNKQQNTTDAVKRFFNDPDVLINEFDINNNDAENMKRINEILISIGCQLNNDKGYESLIKYIKMKESVGYAIWFLLLGLLTILTSQNTILSEECNKSVSDDKTFKKYISSELRE